jgi:hypothetical protein
MGYAIYGVFDWNAVEPVTWIFCKLCFAITFLSESFYMMVGSFFFMRYKSDWQYTSVYDCLYQRSLKRIAKKQNFDREQTEALRSYVKDLEVKLESLNHQ